MLDTATATPSSGFPRPESLADSGTPLAGVGHLSIRRWRCSSCPFTTADATEAQQPCPCDLLTPAGDVPCGGSMVPVDLWCAGCQSSVLVLAVVSDATGPLCPSCARDSHQHDADCAPYLRADDTCGVCGVSHGPECWECGGRGYHRPGCSEIEEPVTQQIPVISMFELVFGEAALLGGGR